MIAEHEIKSQHERLRENYFVCFKLEVLKYEPPHDKTNEMTCPPSEDSDQPGHLLSLIRVFAVRSVGSKGSKLSSCGQRRLIRLRGCPG